MGQYQGEDYISDYDGPEIDNLLGKTVWQSNQNLLVNWYFVGGGSQQGGGQFPINQMGQTSYTGEANYFIDPWLLQHVTYANLTASGLVISGSWGMWQKLENQLPYHTYTASVLYTAKTSTDRARLAIIDSSENTLAVATSYATDDLISVSFTGDTVKGIYAGFTNGNVDGTVTFKAAKLEPGNKSTLAHKDSNGNWILNDAPPNFQQELAKCQRYYQLYATQSLRPSKAEDCRPVMRITPAQGTISIGGTTFYYNDAYL